MLQRDWNFREGAKVALISCRECGGPVSSKASSCPKCGAKVPKFKWWLWVPLGLVIAFIGYGMSIPEHVADARAKRRICEEQLIPRGMASKYDCDKVYDDTIRAGRK